MPHFHSWYLIVRPILEFWAVYYKYHKKGNLFKFKRLRFTIKEEKKKNAEYVKKRNLLENMVLDG